MGKKSNAEHHLQHECVKWYYNDFKGKYGTLWANFSETMSGHHGSYKTALGLKRGVSDLCYCPYRNLIGIEMKYPDTYHDVKHVKEQCKFLLEICSEGWFCDSLESFQNIVRGGRGGVYPEKVLNYLENVKSKTFLWNNKKFG